LLGWYLPGRLQMWIIDSTNGPIIITAESLEDEAQFDQAFEMATAILESVQFG